MLSRKVLPAATALVLVIGSILATFATSSAHSRPVRFDPAPGAVLSAAPAQVSGWFTNELRNDPNWNFLRVTDQTGARVDSGQLSLSTDRRLISVPLKSGLAPGRYIVDWRSWDDADGEIFGDCYVFYVGQEAADKAVIDKFRLDGGGSCERVEVSAIDGTPVAGTALTPSEEHEETHDDSADGNGSVPLWGLIVGIGVGAVGGLVGGRVLTGSR